MKPEDCNEWQKYARQIITPKDKDKGFKITKEALDLAKQDFFNRGGKIKVMEPEQEIVIGTGIRENYANEWLNGDIEAAESGRIF